MFKAKLMKWLISSQRLYSRLLVGAIASLVMLSADAIFLTSKQSLFGINSASAAEKVVMKSGIFRVSVPVSDLESFAETGEIPSSLRRIIKATKSDPQRAQYALKQEVPVNFLVLDRALNHPLGGVLLDKVGEVVHTPSDEANRQALRSAIVLSASEDNKISLLEIIQNYPTSEVEVEGDRVIEAAEQIRKFSDGLKTLLDRLPKLPNPQ